MLHFRILKWEQLFATHEMYHLLYTLEKLFKSACSTSCWWALYTQMKERRLKLDSQHTFECACVKLIEFEDNTKEEKVRLLPLRGFQSYMEIKKKNLYPWQEFEGRKHPSTCVMHTQVLKKWERERDQNWAGVLEKGSRSSSLSLKGNYLHFNAKAFIGSIFSF